MNRLSAVVILFALTLVTAIACAPASNGPSNSVMGTFPFTPVFVLGAEYGGNDGGNPPSQVAVILADQPDTTAFCSSGFQFSAPTQVFEVVAVQPDGGIIPGTIQANGLHFFGASAFGASGFFPGDGGRTQTFARYDQGTITFRAVSPHLLAGSFSLTGALPDGGTAQASGGFSTTSICLQ